MNRRRMVITYFQIICLDERFNKKNIKGYGLSDN